MSDIINQNKDILIVFAITVVFAILGVFIWQKQQALPAAVKKARRERRNEKLYEIFISVPFLKSYTKKCYYQIKRIAAAGEHETRTYVVSTVRKGLIAAFIVGIVGTLILENPISIALAWIAAYIMLTHVLRMNCNRLNKSLLANFAPYVGLLREEYLRLDNIAEAFQATETPECLQTVSVRIRDILESADADYELNRFIQDTQCSYVKTLAMASVKINDKGDDTDKDKGQESVFVKALKYIEEDAYSELERLQLLDTKFSNNGLLGEIGGLPTLSLFAMLGTKFIPMVLLSIMSMLQAWYGGLIGQIANAAICAICVIGFTVGSRLMSFEGIQLDDRKSWVYKMLKNPIIAKICAMAEPKKLKKRELEKLLNESSSSRTVLDISCERLTMAVLSFILGIAVCMTATAYQKSYFKSSTQSFSLMANDDLGKYTTEQILAIDQDFIDMMNQILEEKFNGNRQLKAINILNDDQTTVWVKGRFTDLGDVQISDQVARLRKKYDNINSAYFQFWMVLLAALVGFVGFIYPEWDLRKNRLVQVRIEERDDFMQLQTLCTILASANCDVMETLDELSKLTRLYKKKLLTCYLNYATDPEKELERLSNKVKLGNFKHLIKKISLAIDELSMKEAFEGMDIERRHILEERKTENATSTTNKREKANVYLKASFMLCLINTLVLPIVVVGVTSLVDMLAQMQTVM